MLTDPATEARIRCGEELPDVIGQGNPLPLTVDEINAWTAQWHDRMVKAEGKRARVDALLRRFVFGPHPSYEEFCRAIDVWPELKTEPATAEDWAKWNEMVRAYYAGEMGPDEISVKNITDPIGNELLPIRDRWRVRAVQAERKLSAVRELLARHREGEECLTYAEILASLEA